MISYFGAVKRFGKRFRAGVKNAFLRKYKDIVRSYVVLSFKLGVFCQPEPPMAKRRHRILFDLSPALLEFAGIPQTTRQLFDLLSRSPDFEVTGLLWGHSTECLLHHFYKGKIHHRRLENEAEFLSALIRQLNPDKDDIFDYAIKETRAFAHMWIKRRFGCHSLDPTWAEWIWRYYFAPTLPVSARERLAKLPYVATTLTRTYLRERIHHSLSQPLLDTRGYDTLLLQYPFAIRTAPETRKVIRSHDLVPLLYFDTQPNSPQAIRFHQRSISGAKDALFVATTQPVEEELHAVFPGLSLQARTVPHFVQESKTVASPIELSGIIKSRICAVSQPASKSSNAAEAADLLVKDGYFIAVSTLEPRKNWNSLLRAFSILRSSQKTSVRLVVVGSPGWKYESIITALKPLVETGEVLHLSKVERTELDILYRHAHALVYPSYHEGFGLPPLEAAQQGTPAILSDIPVHRWVMKDAALYCDPHDTAAIARSMAELLPGTPGAVERRAELVAQAQKQLGLYSEEKVLEAWKQALLV
jgi:glycosyltransferase involved in cell wall biosynthesis